MDYNESDRKLGPSKPLRGNGVSSKKTRLEVKGRPHSWEDQFWTFIEYGDMMVMTTGLYR